LFRKIVHGLRRCVDDSDIRHCRRRRGVAHELRPALQLIGPHPEGVVAQGANVGGETAAFRSHRRRRTGSEGGAQGIGDAIEACHARFGF
jgi:hypothetical protein